MSTPELLRQLALRIAGSEKIGPNVLEALLEVLHLTAPSPTAILSAHAGGRLRGGFLPHPRQLSFADRGKH